MQDFLVGLGLLFIGGLVATAVNYPVGYSRIGKALVGILGVAAAIGLGIEIGYRYGSGVVIPFVPADRVGAAEAAITSHALPVWLPLSGVAAALFLVFLRALRPILGLSDGHGEQRDGKDEG